MRCRLPGVTLEAQPLGVTFATKPVCRGDWDMPQSPSRPGFSLTLAALSLDIQTDTGRIHP